MCDLTIPLKINKEPNLIIIRAMSAMVKKHLHEFDTCENDATSKELLKKLWKENYKSKFEDDKIVFEKENDKIMFILRWEI
jgi:fructoselysine-6-P-deglycase FrlB-like protein